MNTPDFDTDDDRDVHYCPLCDHANDTGALKCRACGWVLLDLIAAQQALDRERCRWFAKCDRPATGTTPHPILGPVPTCDRCHTFATAK